MISTSGTVSLTARIVIGFVALLVVGHLGIWAYLDYSIQDEFSSHDRRELEGIEASVKQVLAEHSSFEELRSRPQQLFDAKRLHQRLNFVLVDSHGQTIESSYEARFLTGSDWRRTNEPMREFKHEGRVWQTLVTSGILGDSARSSISVLLALDVTERDTFTERYRIKLVIAALLLAAFATLVSFPLVQGALSPLDAMARRAAEISTSRLNERLPVDRVPRELRGLSAAFNETLERLQDSFRRLSEFSSDLAHELRTPIGNMMGEAEIALRFPRTGSEYQAVLASEIEECVLVIRMIDTMLFLARADNAQVVLHQELLNGRAEITRIADAYGAMLADSKLTLQIEGNADIWADPVLLQRALSNLVVNAIAHTDRGGVITVSLSTNIDANVLVEVSNPGAGIPVDVLPRVFDRFFRIEGTSNRENRGAGLGLAIVRSIMQLHGGFASVRSAPNGPTTFTLCFSSANHGRTEVTNLNSAHSPPRRELNATQS